MAATSMGSSAAAVPPVPKDLAAPPTDAVKTPSGLAYKVLRQGTGTIHPDPTSLVKVHWSAWDAAGKMFMNTLKDAAPASLTINRLTKSWIEGLPLMTEGGRTRFWVPPALAYGDPPRRSDWPQGPVVMDVELVEIVGRPPAAPPDVAVVPPEAKRTASGLAYRAIREGTGTRHPKETDRVRVRYTGWTPDGKAFDSSVARRDEYTSRVASLIKGWKEGLQLMVEGEEARFWIPEALAFGEAVNRPDQPGGMVVYDIELLLIE